MERDRTRRPAWLVGITALTLTVPVTLTGTAVAHPTPENKPPETEPAVPDQGEEWVTEYEKKGDRRGSEVMFTGPDDGWVIGLDQDDDSLGTPFVTHWDGQQWSEVDPTELSELRENELRHHTAAALGPDDVWTAGTYGALNAPGQSYGLGHWDGESWTFSTGPDIEDDQVIDGVTMERIGDEVWLGSTALSADGQTRQGDISVDRWVDGKWERLELPEDWATQARSYDITGTAPDNVYLAASTQQNDVTVSQVAHWDGQSWTVEDLPIPQDWADSGFYPTEVAVSHGRIYLWGRSSDDTERLFRSEDGGKSWEHAETPFIGVTDTDVHPESGDLLVSEVPEPFESETAVFDGETWTRYSQPAAIDFPSTAFSAAYVPGTDRMVASILLANSQSHPDRAKQYITTNNPVQ